jgi:hypothetical protein
MRISKQEIPSTYFNDILRDDVKPLSVNDLQPEIIAKFNALLDKGYGDEADVVKERVNYLIPYILQAIDWQKYIVELDFWQIDYYYNRDLFLEATKLTESDFMAHEPLQEAIAELSLSPKPTFEFILFLSYYFYQQSLLKFSSYEQYERLCAAMKAGGDATMDVVVDGKHFKFGNSDFIHTLFTNVDHSAIKKLKFTDDFSEGQQRYKLRQLDYFMVKTLLDYLPIHHNRRQGAVYSQAERNFGLSVLSLCHRLPDNDREGVCSKENNATFDKLMRDFHSEHIPFAMRLFL